MGFCIHRTNFIFILLYSFLFVQGSEYESKWSWFVQLKTGDFANMLFKGIIENL